MFQLFTTALCEDLTMTGSGVTPCKPISTLRAENACRCSVGRSFGMAWLYAATEAVQTY